MDLVAGSKPFIAVLSRPGSTLDERHVRWRIGMISPEGKALSNKQGVVVVRRTGTEKDFDAIAELKALHELLVERGLLGVGRTGNGLFIISSQPAIREMNLWYRALCKVPAAIKKEALKNSMAKHIFDLVAVSTGQAKIAGLPVYNRPHLITYGRFLLGRFFGAEVFISHDGSWINPVPHSHFTFKVDSGTFLPDTIAVPGIGNVDISLHAVEQIAERLKIAEYQRAWTTLYKFLKEGDMRLMEAQREIHHQNGEVEVRAAEYLHIASGLTFVIGLRANGRYTLITLYKSYTEANHVQYR